MQFASPGILWIALGAVPAVAAFLWWAWKRKKQLIGQFVRSRLLANLTVGVSDRRQKTRQAMLVVSVALLFLALAGPQWGFAWEEAHQRGLDIVVAIDTSRSMLASDVPPNRLTRAKLAALDLMRLARNDRMGLVAFAGSAFLQCPLTLDEDAFRQSINAVDVGIIPQGGTALTEAIQAAAGAFKDEGDNHKVLVLFTDGEDHEDGAVTAATEAAKKGLRIFTVGVGTPEGELIQEKNEKGVPNFVKDDSGNVVKSRLNESLLQEIATKANGFYLPLRGGKPMETLYERGLAPLPKGEISSKLVKHFHERYHWPLALAILLLLGELFYPERQRVKRSAAITNASNPELRKAVVALLLLSLAFTSVASPASAFRKLNDGHYSEALKEYKSLLEKNPDDPRLHYNAGSAAYRAGEFETAAKEFEAALASQGLDLQQSAYYNLGNSLFRSGEHIPEPDKKSASWEEAVHHYESALKLNPSDADAKFNLELVKKRLEELKKQQQQKDQSSDSDKQDKDNQNKQQQQDKDQQKQKNKENPNQQENKDDKGKGQDKKQNQDEKKQDQSKKQEDQKKDDQKSAQNQSGQKDKPEDKSGQQAKQNQGQQGQQTNGAPGEASMAMGQMTPQQAKQILDSQKGEEKALLFIPPEKARSNNRVFKDW